MRKPKPPHMTLDEIKEHAEKEFPYIVGQGTSVLRSRTTLQKKLMTVHGYPINIHIPFSPPTAGGGRRGIFEK